MPKSIHFFCGVIYSFLIKVCSMEFRKTKALTIEIKKEQQENLSSKSKIEKMLKQDDVIGFDIYDNNTFLGFAMLKEWGKGKFFLWDYLIKYEMQNKGYGTKVLLELIDLLKVYYDCKVLTTTYKYGNIPAEKLYKKVGFVETDVVCDGDIQEVNMILNL